MKRSVQVSLAILLTALFLIPFAGIGGKKEKKYPSFYRQNIRVDGQAAEWDAPLFFFDKHSGIYFALANDSTNLFICLKVKDEQEQHKIIRGGMYLYIDPKGKKNRETGVCFPMGMAGDRMEHIMSHPGGGRPDQKSVRLMLQLRMQDMECMGFAEGNGIQNRRNNHSGIMAVVDWDSSNFLVYEAKIPLRLISPDLSLSDPFTAGIKVKGMDQNLQRPPDGERGQEGMGGGRENMPGQMDNRGMGGGMPQETMGDPSERQRMFEDDNFWFPFTIAKPAETR